MKNQIMFVLTVCCFSIITIAQSSDSLLNQPVPMQKIMSIHSQPDMMEFIGKLPGQYYGSGDINHDGKIDSLVLSSSLDEADIDGDGNPGTENDQAIIDSVNAGLKSYLPRDWNKLTKNEKVYWLEKMISIDITDEMEYENFYGWDCDNFSNQHEINFFGKSNIDEYISSGATPDGELQLKENNGRFNIPVYEGGVVSTGGVLHSINAVLIGENACEFNDWYFFEPQTDQKVVPGDWSMHPDEYATIYWNGYFDNPLDHGNNDRGAYFGSFPIVEFDLEGGEVGNVGFPPYTPRVNPNKITLEIVEPEKLLLVEEISLNEIPMTELEINTNLDLTTPYHHEFEEGTDYYGLIYDGQNIADIKRIFSEPIPLEEGEAGEKHFKVIETYYVCLIQRTKSNAYANMNFDFIVKSDSVKREVEFEIATGITTINIPIEFKLCQNYPNPFNPSTTIKYKLPQNGFTTLEVYDVIGRRILTLIAEEQNAGVHEVKFNAESLSSGIYYYRIKVNDFIDTKKMILLK